MRQLSDTQTAILQNLARFRFLTVDQMRAIGINTGKSKAHLYRVLAELCDAPALVEKFTPKPIHGKGTFPSLHYLTAKGAECLAELLQCDIGDLKRPKGKVALSRMLVHMTRCIWCEIYVTLWAAAHGHAVDYYFNDFDTEGDNRTGKNGRLRKMTRIDLDNGERLIPDAVFHLTDPAGNPRLFLLEVHNEMRSKRIHEKLADYREAIAQGAVNRQFHYEHSPRVLTIFQEHRHVEHARDAMAKSGKFRGWEAYFFLKTLDELPGNFPGGWEGVNGPKSLF